MDNFIFQTLWAEASSLKGTNGKAHDFIKHLWTKYDLSANSYYFVQYWTSADQDQANRAKTIVACFRLITYVKSIMQSKRALKNTYRDFLEHTPNWLFYIPVNELNLTEILTYYRPKKLHWSFDSFVELDNIDQILINYPGYGVELSANLKSLSGYYDSDLRKAVYRRYLINKHSTADRPAIKLLDNSLAPTLLQTTKEDIKQLQNILDTM